MNPASSSEQLMNVELQRGRSSSSPQSSIARQKPPQPRVFHRYTVKASWPFDFQLHVISNGPVARRKIRRQYTPVPKEQQPGKSYDGKAAWLAVLGLDVL